MFSDPFISFKGLSVHLFYIKYQITAFANFYIILFHRWHILVIKWIIKEGGGGSRCTTQASVLTGSKKVKSRFSIPKYSSFFSSKDWLMYLTMFCMTNDKQSVLISYFQIKCRLNKTIKVTLIRYFSAPVMTSTMTVVIPGKALRSVTLCLPLVSQSRAAGCPRNPCQRGKRAAECGESSLLH